MKSSLNVALLQSAIVLVLLVHAGWAIMCHNCSTVNDPRCNDPFDVEKNKDFLVDCGLERPDAVYCRKIDQTVNGERRVFRRCAWEEHKRYNCYFGTTQYYRAQYCICNNTDGCNGALSLKPSKVYTIEFSLVVGVIIIAFSSVLGL